MRYTFTANHEIYRYELQTMKQLLQNLKTGETSVADVPIPSPKPGTALIRTAASLVSAVVPIIVFFLAQRVFMQGVVFTGVEK